LQQLQEQRALADRSRGLQQLLELRDRSNLLTAFTVSVSNVVVICGERTNKAIGVDVELKIAQEEKKPYFLLAGHADKTCTRPPAAKPSDKLYKWTWENLKNLVSGAR